LLPCQAFVTQQLLALGNNRSDWKHSALKNADNAQVHSFPAFHNSLGILNDPAMPKFDGVPLYSVCEI